MADNLADLIAAHELNYESRDRNCLCGNRSWGTDTHAAHVALVVEQHTNGRTAEYIKQLESERETVTSMCSELESIRDEQAARIAELEALRRVDQDLFVQTLAIANQRKERAEKAEAAIAKVEKLQGDLFQQGGNLIAQWGAARLIRAALQEEFIRAALEGEQQ